MFQFCNDRFVCKIVTQETLFFWWNHYYPSKSWYFACTIFLLSYNFLFHHTIKLWAIGVNYNLKSEWHYVDLFELWITLPRLIEENQNLAIGSTMSWRIQLSFVKFVNGNNKLSYTSIIKKIMKCIKMPIWLVPTHKNDCKNVPERKRPVAEPISHNFAQISTRGA